MSAKPEIMSIDHRWSMSVHFYRVMGEVIIFALLAVLLGFTITYMMPDTSPDEPIWSTCLYLILQIIINAVIIFLVDNTYVQLFGFDSDTYIGMTIFTMLLLITQIQIYNRVSKIYYALTGNKITRHGGV
jgi:hypothetical protein